MYELRCLGEASLRGPGGQLIHFRSRKHFALLAYLALNSDRAHRRERLAGLLWSDAEDSRARHSLSQALYAVRRLLEGAVLIEGEDLELRSHNLQVDAVQLQRLFESGEAAAAADLYRGDFLEGFWVRGAQGFEEWAGRERARVAGLARDALRSAIRAARERCEWSEVRCRAERLVELDPFDEAAQAELMRALWMLGDRAAALARYEELERVLASELGSAPSRETTELAARIRERSVRGGWTAPVLRENGPSPFDEPAFVGRKAELAVLSREFAHVTAGESRQVSLVGAAGIGKTRLADEFFKSLALSDATLLRGACYEAESALPYGPVAEALKRGLAELELVHVAPLWLAELARIVPEVAELCGELPRPPELDAEGGRRRLYEGIAQVLRGACESRPVVFFVDDLHWADDSSLSLLHYLRRRVSNGLYLLTAHRPEELVARESSALDKLLVDSGEIARVIELRALDAAQSADLLRALLGADPDTGAVRSLREMSGGNPLFAIELARAFAERAPGAVGRPRVPESVKMLLGRRFAGLDKQARIVLRQAAFLGSRSSYEALTAAVGLPPLEFDAVIQDLMRARILVESEGLVCFRHDLLREVAVEHVPTALSGALHRRAARALIRADGTPGEIARHLAEAGDRRRAYVYALRGAAQAEQVYAFQEAADLLGLAIEHAPTQSGRHNLLGRLGKLYLHTRRYALARPPLEERLAFLKSSGRRSLDILEAERDLLLLNTYSCTVTIQQSALEMRRLLEQLELSGETAPRLEAELLHSLFWAATRSFNTSLVDETITRLRTLHRRALQPEVRCRTARSLGIYYCYAGQLRRAEQLLNEARDNARQANDQIALVDVYVGFTLLLHRTIRQELAEYILAEAVPLAMNHADPARASFLLSNCAVCHIYLRNTDHAEELLQRALRTLTSAGETPELSPSIQSNLGFVAKLRRDYIAAEEYWHQALVASERHGVLTVTVETLAALGTLALEKGDVMKARRLATRAIRLARHAKYLLDQRLGIYDLLVRLAYQEGNKEKALRRVSRIAERARRGDLPFYLTAQRTRLEILIREGSQEAHEVAAALSEVARESGAGWWAEEADRLLRKQANPRRSTAIAAQNEAPDSPSGCRSSHRCTSRER